MDKKTCFKCGESLPLSSFYSHPQMADGYVNKCKECNKIDVRKNYRKNKNHYQEYEKERSKRPERIAYTISNTKRWRQENPIKYKAHRILNNALRDGKIVKGLCEICQDSNVHAHHFDYTKPLDVIWLCPQHHKDVHLENCE